MVKKIRLLGMVIDNFTLHEELMQSEELYKKQELNIIRTISTKMLSMAAESQTIRAGIRQADLLVVGDREILTAAGIYSAQRLREANEHGFMQEYLKLLSHSGRSAFLVAQNQQELEILKEFLQKTYEKQLIVGGYALDACSSDSDMMVNEINAAAPDVVLSVISSPQEDDFLLQEKVKISARVWYSLGEGYRNMGGKLSFMLWFRQLIHRGRFRNVIHDYEEYDKDYYNREI